MVNLTRIYTRTGDGGKTRLGDMSETSKTDLRLQAYADVDETNAHIGLVLATGELDDDVAGVLTHVQNDLFDVGADFCTPVVENPEYPPLRIEADYVDGSRAGATSTTRSCPSCGRSSSTAARSPGPTCTSPARCAGAQSARRGPLTRSTPTR